MDALKMISNGRFYVLATDGSFYRFGEIPKGSSIEYDLTKINAVKSKYPSTTFILSPIHCEFTRYGVVA
jgi:hypothetical protein